MGGGFIPARSRHAAWLAVSAGLVLAPCAAALADVRTSTQYRSYSVSGSTPKSLVSYMRSNPFRGDHGDAVANVRPEYRLSVATRASGGTCRASGVTLHIHFVMTLPKARSEAAMAAGTLGAWRNFAAFAKRHEETHRRIYVECGNAFVAKAKRMTHASCAGLQTSIRRLLETEKRACQVRQRAFDRADYNRIRSLSLFRMAGSSR